MYNKCYNAKFQVQDDEQQLNGKRVPIHLAVPIHFCSCGFRSVRWQYAVVPLIS